MILHIPHSSTEMLYTVRVKNLVDSINLMTDWFADELFFHPDAESIVFETSRLCVDVERYKNDEMRHHGKGFLYDTDVHGDLIYRTDDEYSEDTYDQYHYDLNSMVYSHIGYFPIVTIVDCHTFNDIPLQWEAPGPRPDICIGTDDFHTPQDLVMELTKYFHSKNLTVRINDPYSGTMVPSEFSDDKCLKSIMIEVNKRLYLNDKYQKNDNFGEVKDIITEALDIINEWERREEGEFWEGLS